MISLRIVRITYTESGALPGPAGRAAPSAWHVRIMSTALRRSRSTWGGISLSSGPSRNGFSPIDHGRKQDPGSGERSGGPGAPPPGEGGKDDLRASPVRTVRMRAAPPRMIPLPPENGAPAAAGPPAGRLIGRRPPQPHLGAIP